MKRTRFFQNNPLNKHTEFSPAYENLILEAYSSSAYLMVNKTLISTFGAEEAIFISNIIDKYRYHKQQKTLTDNGFFLIHEKQIEQTGLTEYALKQCKKLFINVGVISTFQIGIPSKEYYILHIDQLAYFVGLDPSNSMGLKNTNSTGLDPSNSGSLYSKNKYNKNKLNENKVTSSLLEDDLQRLITLSDFDSFWEIYPKKADKGKAYTSFKKICQKPSKDKPTWESIRRAILRQKRSERWKDKQYIPHPTTWLNQSRWLDDPSEMKVFKRISDTPPNSDALVQEVFCGRQDMYKQEILRVLKVSCATSDLDRVITAVCELYKHVSAKQLRPDLNSAPKVNDPGYSTYRNWKDLIPTPFRMLTGYLKFLQDKHVKDFNSNLFTDQNKYFMWYIRELKERIQCDPFTGR
jgi:hypothetical protein